MTVPPAAPEPDPVTEPEPVTDPVTEPEPVTEPGADPVGGPGAGPRGGREPEPEPEPAPRGRGRPRSRLADQAILDATIELLQRHGVTGLSIEAVARRANVAKTTVYRRWPSKHDLVFDVLAQLRRVALDPPAGQSVRDDLIFMLTLTRQVQAEPTQGGLLRRMIGEVEAYPELAQAYLDRLVAPRRERFLDVMRRGVREGAIRADADLSLAAEALVGPVLLGAWVPYGPRIRQAQIPALVDLVLAGIAAASPCVTERDTAAPASSGG